VDDRPIQEAPEPASLETALAGDRTVTLADLVAVFTIFLGRVPEDPQEQKAYWETRQLSELLRVFAASVEFGNIQNILVDDGILAGGEGLSRTERTQADLWLSRMTPGHGGCASADWAELLLAGVTSAELMAMGGPVLSLEALAALRDVAETRRQARAKGLDLVLFDADTFVAARAHRCYQGAQGEVDFDAPIARTTRAPVMLPLFTEGLEALRRPGPLTLGDWLEQTRDAALAGSLTHWLWEEATYRRNRAVVERDLDADAPDGLAYLDLLTVGDAAGVSGHPLFCPHAYRTLNRGAWEGEGGGFRHFVEGGEAAGLRTSALFDPDFYLAVQPEVALQLASGLYASPLEHFIRVGLAAGFAFCPDFDRHFYLIHHPDVGQAIADGTVPSAEWHYVFQGAREGRPPNPYFNPWYYLQRYPFAAGEMARLGIASSLEHFLLLGQARGWSVNPPLGDRTVAPDDGRALFEKRGRRAYGEIIDGGITIPGAGAPRLSVILPVSNQADLTAGFLKSAAYAIEVLRSRRAIETEIIVIDSGSRDHTEALLAALPHVVVIRPAETFSFPAAVNLGAAKARGDVLLVANNDIEFQPDAFDRVFAALDDDPEIGLLGAKVILPNETLQEVGAALDRLGNTQGAGRGSDAWRVTNNRRLAVDYASGCFIAFRRADFDALSGFAEAFSPGYYEDVDFALRIKRDLNKSTVIDTGLAVTHYENASFAKGRPATVNMSGAMRNRLLLKTRHAALFRTMPAPGAKARAAVARQALSGATRVLVIQDCIPSAHLGPRFARCEAILDAFTRMGVAFDIVALEPNPQVDGYKDPRAAIFRSWMPGQSLQEVLQLQGATYSHLWVCGAANLAGHAAALAQARADHDLKLVCDVEALPGQDAVEQMRLDAGAADDAVVLSALANELMAPIDVDGWVTVDDRDRALVERIGLGPVVEIGHGARLPDAAVSERPFAERERILFIGSGFDQGNAEHDGLEWLLAEVWPRLADLPDQTLTLVGAWEEGAVQDVLRRFANRVDVVGVADGARLSRIFSETRVAVVPDRLAADRFGKVATAALAGVPTVMTDIVADRLGVAADATIAHAVRDDGGQSFAEWVTRLYTQERVWRSQIKKQRAAVAAMVGREGIVQQVKAALDGAETPGRS